MPITLREEVAEAIFKALPFTTRSLSDANETTQHNFLIMSDAAIAIVLKRAAEAVLATGYYGSRAGYVAILSLANNEPTP